MRQFFQPRSRERAPSPAQPSRPAPQAAAAAVPHLPTRAELEGGVTVSELSELEARALCAREGIPFFWREAAAGA